jgi:hypothetical protein
MPKAFTINIGFDNPTFILGSVVSPFTAMYLSDYDQFTYAVILTKADSLEKAIAIANLYNTGDSIMPNSLIVHSASYTDAVEHELVQISTTGAVGEQVTSLKVSNKGVSDAVITFKVTDSSDVVKIEFTETVQAGKNLVPISAMDRMNLLDTDKFTVTSDTAVAIDYYLSTNLGVII